MTARGTKTREAADSTRAVVRCVWAMSDSLPAMLDALPGTERVGADLLEALANFLRAALDSLDELDATLAEQEGLERAWTAFVEALPDRSGSVASH